MKKILLAIADAFYTSMDNSFEEENYNTEEKHFDNLKEHYNDGFWLEMAQLRERGEKRLNRCAMRLTNGANWCPRLLEQMDKVLNEAAKACQTYYMTHTGACANIPTPQQTH